MYASPLKKLPAELRNRIYELALHNPNGITIILEDERPSASHPAAALTATCREIRKDTLSMFYASNYFVAFMEPINADNHTVTLKPLTRLERWIKEIGADSAGYVRHLCLELGQHHDRSRFPHICKSFGRSVQGLDLPNAALSLGFTVIDCGDVFLPTHAMRINFQLSNQSETISCIHDVVQKEKASLLLKEEKESRRIEEDRAPPGWLGHLQSDVKALDALWVGARQSRRRSVYRSAQREVDKWGFLLEALVLDSTGWREGVC